VAPSLSPCRTRRSSLQSHFSRSLNCAGIMIVHKQSADNDNDSLYIRMEYQQNSAFCFATKNSFTGKLSQKTMNARKTLIMFGMIALIFSSCSDDDSPSTQNTVTLDDGKFNISTATIVGVAIDGEGHAGISFIEANNTMSKTLKRGC